MASSAEPPLDPALRIGGIEASSLAKEHGGLVHLELEEERDNYAEDLERDRTVNDQRLKSRFEGIFEKYGRDFTGIGDEIDIATGEIVVDNGHLANMQHEADPGESASSQFVRAFAQNLEHEDENGSSVDNSEASDLEDGYDSNETVSECQRSISCAASNGAFSAREQSTESNTSPAEMDGMAIDPLLQQLNATVNMEPTLLVDGTFKVDEKASGTSGRSPQDVDKPMEDCNSKSVSVLNMDLRDLKESMLELKTKAENGREFDLNAIEALSRSIADQITQFIGGGNSKLNRAPKKRKNGVWDYPELPTDKRQRIGTSSSQRPHLPGLSSIISPQRISTRAEPKESLWAPLHHPKPRKPRRSKKKESQSLAPGQARHAEPSSISLTVADETQDELQEPDTSANPMTLKKCYNCGICVTTNWRKGPDGDLCNACGMYYYRYGLLRPPRPPSPESDLTQEPEPDAKDQNVSDRATGAFRPLNESKSASGRAQFTVEEDALIIKLKEIDHLSWEKIGRHFEGRSLYCVQCRYSKNLLPGMPSAGRDALVEQGFVFETKPFTKQEDELVVQLRDDAQLDFAAIAERIPDQTADSVEKRYNELMGNYPALDEKYDRLGRLKPTADPDLPKQWGSRWSNQEHEKLIRLREASKLSWHSIISHFPGRSGMSLQKRYVRELAYRKSIVSNGGEDPYAHIFGPAQFSAIDIDESVLEQKKQTIRTMELAQFSKVEDAVLLRLRDDNKWSFETIVQHFPERNADLLRMRYGYLKAKQVKPATDTAPLEDPSIYDIPESEGLGQDISKSRPLVRSGRFTRGEDALIMKLKGQGLTWEQIGAHFPGRTASALEKRFSKRLRHFPSISVGEGNKIENATALDGFSAAIVSRQALRDQSEETDESSWSEAESDHSCSLFQDVNFPRSQGVLPAADFPGLDGLSESELGLSRSKETWTGPRLSALEENLLRSLRNEGRSWEEISPYFPGRSASSLAQYWLEHLSKSWDKKLPLPAATAMTPLLRQALFNETRRNSNGGVAPLNLFNTLLRGGTTATIAGEVSPSLSTGNHEKAKKTLHGRLKRPSLLPNASSTVMTYGRKPADGTVSRPVSISSDDSDDLARQRAEMLDCENRAYDNGQAMILKDPITHIQPQNQRQQEFPILATNQSSHLTPIPPAQLTSPAYQTPAKYHHHSLPYYAAAVPLTWSPVREDFQLNHIAAKSEPQLSGEGERLLQLPYKEHGEVPTHSRESTTSARNSIEPEESTGAKVWDRENSAIAGIESFNNPTTGRLRCDNAPPFSWLDLVSMALKSVSSNRMSTDAIQEYLQEKFPYFETASFAWKSALQAFLKNSTDFEYHFLDGEDSWGFAQKTTPAPTRTKKTRPRDRHNDGVLKSSKDKFAYPVDPVFIPVPEDAVSRSFIMTPPVDVLDHTDAVPAGPRPSCTSTSESPSVCSRRSESAPISRPNLANVSVFTPQPDIRDKENPMQHLKIVHDSANCTGPAQPTDADNVNRLHDPELHQLVYTNYSWAKAQNNSASLAPSQSNQDVKLREPVRTPAYAPPAGVSPEVIDLTGCDELTNGTMCQTASSEADVKSKFSESSVSQLARKPLVTSLITGKDIGQAGETINSRAAIQSTLPDEILAQRGPEKSPKLYTINESNSIKNDPVTPATDMVRRGPGRPRKFSKQTNGVEKVYSTPSHGNSVPRRGRGRPPKAKPDSGNPPRRGRRPKYPSAVNNTVFPSSQIDILEHASPGMSTPKRKPPPFSSPLPQLDRTANDTDELVPVAASAVSHTQSMAPTSTQLMPENNRKTDSSSPLALADHMKSVDTRRFVLEHRSEGEALSSSGQRISLPAPPLSSEDPLARHGPHTSLARREQLLAHLPSTQPANNAHIESKAKKSCPPVVNARAATTTPPNTRGVGPSAHRNHGIASVTPRACSVGLGRQRSGKRIVQTPAVSADGSDDELAL
ncbi:hypothetical protein M433DRAFT_20542 [Acidomyces richmondensis BFW]|nr:MAG: hypothetical protein FE78DRAFT_102381 [Acidomyces sp. 'richmondensis']KYG50526.1 hypothetical protein M433DRAFT_20542 [Acidomyces richmondensis BFW]